MNSTSLAAATARGVDVGERAQVGLRARRGGQRGDRGLDRATVGERILDPVAAAPQTRQHLLDPRAILVGPEDEVAAAVAATPALDHVVVHEQPDRLLHGRAPDPEAGRELALGRQRLAGRDQPQDDLAADLLGDVLVRPLLLEALEPDRVGFLLAARHGRLMASWRNGARAPRAAGRGRAHAR